jgi:hypothetical protein
VDCAVNALTVNTVQSIANRENRDDRRGGEIMSDAVVERTVVPTVFEWQAKQIEDAGKILAFWIGTTREDKLGWKPRAEGEESKTRTIYDQIGECAQVNRRFASILQGQDPGPWQEIAEYPNAAAAEEAIRSSAAELAQVIRGLDDGALERQYVTARGSMSGAFAISLALNNMHYHGGQINQTQMLYGDEEFRFPE